MLIACSTHNPSPANADHGDAGTSTCSGLTEQQCGARTDCHAVYTTTPNCTPCQPGGAYMSCAAGVANCTLTGACGFGDVGCPTGFKVAFVIPDGNCQHGFDIEGCVRTSECPP
jgi:hypothetical protein